MRRHKRFRSVALFLFVSLVGAAGTAAIPADAPEASGLRVEQIQWEPDGAGGGLIEVSYRLIAVTELPRHPSITYLYDEETGTRLELQRVAMLPPTEMSADEAPLGRFDLKDREGRFWPGDEVSVVVAGLVQKGVTIQGEVPEGYREAGVGSDPDTAPAPDGPAEAKLEVIKLMVAGGGALLDLRYRLSGVTLVQADEHDSYIQKPETGEKFYVLGVARIGTLATKNPGAAKTSFILIQNSERKIKVGDRVTVVISGAKQENVLVEDPVGG
jgi:hypothetical protein